MDTRDAGPGKEQQGEQSRTSEITKGLVVESVYSAFFTFSSASCLMNLSHHSITKVYTPQGTYETIADLKTCLSTPKIHVVK